MTNMNGSAKRINTAIKVFIFEDHWMCREALVSLLCKETWIELVGAAEDVRKNLDNAVHVRPDVVLMDILFQGRKLGIEATREIKKKLPDTKVVMFTEFPDAETLRDAVTAGASGYLLKKDVHDPDILFQAIRSVHLGEAYMTPSMTSRIITMVKKLSEEPKYDLTRREHEVLKLVTEGMENREIGSALNIDIRTVANHMSNLLFKMNARNRTEAAAIARREGLVK